MRSRWAGLGRLPAVHRQHHVAALEAQAAVPGGADHQHPLGGAEVLAQIGVERGQLEVAEGAARPGTRTGRRGPCRPGSRPPASGSPMPGARTAWRTDRRPAWPLTKHVGLVLGDHRDRPPVLAPAVLDRHGVVGLEPGGQLDQPEAGQRLPLVRRPLGLAAGQDRLAVELGDDVARAEPGLGGRAVGSDRLDVGAEGVGVPGLQVDLDAEPGPAVHHDLHHPVGARDPRSKRSMRPSRRRPVLRRERDRRAAPRPAAASATVRTNGVAHVDLLGAQSPALLARVTCTSTRASSSPTRSRQSLSSCVVARLAAPAARPPPAPGPPGRSGPPAPGRCRRCGRRAPGSSGLYWLSALSSAWDRSMAWLDLLLAGRGDRPRAGPPATPRAIDAAAARPISPADPAAGAPGRSARNRAAVSGQRSRLGRSAGSALSRATRWCSRSSSAWQRAQLSRCSRAAASPGSLPGLAQAQQGFHRQVRHALTSSPSQRRSR